MSVFALKRYGSNDDSDFKHHHLSLVSRDDDGWSVIDTADLPFFDSDERVFGGGCRGLVYFAGRRGTVVVCNLTTRMWKVFPPPEDFSFSTPIDLQACGLGYDLLSDDYKILRLCLQYKPTDEYGGYQGFDTHTEVYSFKSGLWNKIDTPGAWVTHRCSLYHDGRCYWPSVLNDQFGGEDHYPGNIDHILTFDLATEEFGHLSFPDASIADGSYGRSKVFEYHGSLAALIHGGPGPNESLRINLFRLREWDDAWELLYDTTLYDVSRPLDFVESYDGYILFLEGNGRELVSYNFNSEELKRLGILSGQAASFQAEMIAIHFDCDGYQIPDSEAMAFVAPRGYSSGASSEIQSEDEEDAVETNDGHESSSEDEEDAVETNGHESSSEDEEDAVETNDGHESSSEDEEDAVETNDGHESSSADEEDDVETKDVHEYSSEDEDDASVETDDGDDAISVETYATSVETDESPSSDF